VQIASAAEVVQQQREEHGAILRHDQKMRAALPAPLDHGPSLFSKQHCTAFVATT
jgi:hypothetical protein